MLSPCAAAWPLLERWEPPARIGERLCCWTRGAWSRKGLRLTIVPFRLGYVIPLLLFFFCFFKSLQLRYRHELSDRVSAARPRRQGHIYAAQISTGQWIRFDTRYLKYRGGDPLLSLVLSLAAPRPLR